MTIFKGDRVIRVDGTAVGFRRNETFEAVDVSRTHIKVKNANGLISKWFERKDFQIWEQRNRRKECWVVLYQERGGRVNVSHNETLNAANNAIRIINGVAGTVILAKKKIIIPYQEAGL